MEKNRKLPLASVVSIVALLISLATIAWNIGFNMKKLNPQISIDTNCETLKANDSFVAIKMKITLKNPSDNKVLIYHARYKVYGCYVMTENPTVIKDQFFDDEIMLDTSQPMPGVWANSDSLYSYSKSSFYNVRGELIEIGKLDCETADFSFSPNETHNTLKNIMVPSKYNIAKIIVYLHYGDYNNKGYLAHEDQRGTNISEIFIR